MWMKGRKLKWTEFVIPGPMVWSAICGAGAVWICTVVLGGFTWSGLVSAVFFYLIGWLIRSWVQYKLFEQCRKDLTRSGDRGKRYLDQLRDA